MGGSTASGGAAGGGMTAGPAGPGTMGPRAPAKAGWLTPQISSMLGKAGPIFSGAAGQQPDLLGQLAAMGPPPQIQPVGPAPAAPGGQIGQRLADIMRPPYKVPQPMLPRTRGEAATNPAAGGFSGVGGELLRRY